MNDTKQNYAAVAESEFDLRREVVRLRDINKDLLEACRRVEEAWAGGNGDMASAVDGVLLAIAKAEGK